MPRIAALHPGKGSQQVHTRIFPLAQLKYMSLLNQVNEVFRAGGVLARSLPNYEVREGQITMAKSIASALESGKTLMVEGPTGTGKSLAYLVPATYLASKAGKRVAVCTANIPLQEQLVQKDLPLLQSVLPWQVNYALLKGKSNYLCLRQMDEMRKHGNLPGGSKFTAYDSDLQKQIRRLDTWSGNTTSGDRSELSFEPHNVPWGLFSTSSDECTGGACPRHDKCHAVSAMNRARNAQVVVVNYHLLFADIIAGRNLLEDYDYLIMDEAHRAADIARTFFGFRITEKYVRYIVRRLGPLAEGGKVAHEAKIFFSRLYDLKTSKAYSNRLKERVGHYTALVDALLDAHERFKRLARRAGNGDRDVLTNSGELCKKAAQNIEEACLLGDDTKVYFIEDTGKGYVALAASVVSVSGKLRSNIFNKIPTIVTSATLATNNSYGFAKAELGCYNADTLTTDSPFNWGAQALLVLPKGLPDPGGAGKDLHRKMVAKTTISAIKLARGRSLVLCTSTASMEYCCGRAREQLSQYKILKQGDLPRAALIKEFSRDVSSVLFGTESFWAGVDVPGESLSCVVIDKLPFPSMDDPILGRIKDENEHWFYAHSLPRAITMFRQGFGRLIRTMDDFGVVVLLDPRAETKGYGDLFLEALPDVAISNDLADIDRFLNQ